MKIQDYLDEHGIAYEEHEHAAAYTAQEVAAEEHVSGNMMAKAVVVHADEKFAMCVLPASYKLDMEKAAERLHASDVYLADEREMAKLFPDAEVGAEPPFGSLYDMPTYVDEHLAAQEELTFQAGTHRQTIRMRYSDYAQLVQPAEADLAIHL